jgi:hypothetical protein
MYEIVFGKIYVLQNQDNLDELLLTYNINADSISIKSFHKDTISVHRKKDFNTLYTINSMNELIKNLNNGILDTKYPINWSDYKNSILLVDQQTSIKIIPTKLHQIIKI